jgi:hypothetical protein
MKVSAEAPAICPYRIICGPCEGLRELFRVQLNSGDVAELTNVESVELTARELIVRLSEGEPVSFPRNEVYFAGCGHMVPTFSE